MEAIDNHIMPLFLAAPVSWYVQAFGQTEIVLKNDIRFPKQTYRHKLDYVTVEGVQTFSIPLVKDTRHLDYRSVEISYQAHWQSQLIHALRTSYGKSPFFEYYDYRFEEVIRTKYQYLWDLNYRILEVTLQCLRLDISLHIEKTGAHVPDPVFDQPPQTYYQVFADKVSFTAGMSILDLVFNEGINAWQVLKDMQK